MQFAFIGKLIAFRLQGVFIMGVRSVLDDLTGKRFGRLSVISRYGTDKPVRWNCVCDCGKERVVWTINLKKGDSQSCGCLRDEINSKHNRTHGHSIGGKTTPEFRAWASMKSRCYNVNLDDYSHWGGRGIIVCDRWLDKENGFLNFFEDMGERPSPKHSIDRFPDTNGNYFKENCRWATKKEQQGNTTRNVCIEYVGKKMILSDWAGFFKVTPSTLWEHLFIKHRTIEYVYNFYLKKGNIK